MRKWLPLFSVALGTFMLLIDVTIVNVALPSMASDLHTSFGSLQWVIDIYALSLAALLLGIGAISDIVGRRPVYVGGLVTFALASLAAGTSANTTILIVARGVQGAGAAAMFATTIALLNISYTGRDRGVAFGVWGATNGAAAAAGPMLGGVLTEYLSWRWIFFVNLPISVLAVAVSMRVLSRDEPRRSRRIDVLGMALFTISAAAFTFGLTRASELGWGSGQTIGSLATGAAALAAFGVVESRTREPLLDLRLLRRVAFSAVQAASFIYSFSAFAYLTYVSLWLQSVRDMSPIQAGAAVIPLSLAALLVSLSIGRHLDSPNGRRWAIGGGLALIGVGALINMHLGAGSDWVSVVPGLVISGIGVGLISPTVASAAVASVPQQEGGMASGALNTMRQLGYALGIAGLGVVVQSRITTYLHGMPGLHHAAALGKAIAGGQARGIIDAAPTEARPALHHAIHGAFASGLNGALLIAGIAGLLGGAVVLIALRPQPQLRAQASGSRRIALEPVEHSADRRGVGAQGGAPAVSQRHGGP
jgi:EmrB/QacA subfamily drug resistance transporter